MWARTLLGRLADVSCLSALTNLQELWPSKFQADGGCLNALASLQKLGLLDTQVTGDIGSVGARKVLDVLATPAMMTGVVNSPSALLSRQALHSCVKESAAGLEGPLSRAARLSI